MPSDDGDAITVAQDFFDYVEAEFPDTASHWEFYDTESEFLDIVDASDYSRDPTDERPAFVAGVVFTSGSPDWEYTVRVCVWEPGFGGSWGGGGTLSWMFSFFFDWSLV